MKIDEAVRAMDPPRYTRTQAAMLVGRDSDTLKRWKQTGQYVPSDFKFFGKVRVGLYTDADIAAIRQMLETLKPGRKTQERRVYSASA